MAAQTKGVIMHTEFQQGNRDGKADFETQSRMHNNIKMKLCEYMGWIILAKHRDEWRAVVSSVMKVKAKKDDWRFLTGGFTGSV